MQIRGVQQRANRKASSGSFLRSGKNPAHLEKCFIKDAKQIEAVVGYMLRTKLALFQSLIMALAYLGQCIYMVDGHIDWFRLCLVFGLPFGIPYMLWVVPIGGNPATSVVVLVLNVIVGASIGSLIAVFALLRAAVYMTRWIVNPGRDQ